MRRISYKPDSASQQCFKHWVIQDNVSPAPFSAERFTDDAEMCIQRMVWDKLNSNRDLGSRADIGFPMKLFSCENETQRLFY